MAITVTVSGPEHAAVAEVIAAALLNANIAVALDPNHGPMLPERHRRLHLETLPPLSVNIVEQTK